MLQAATLLLVVPYSRGQSQLHLTSCPILHLQQPHHCLPPSTHFERISTARSHVSEYVSVRAYRCASSRNCCAARGSLRSTSSIAFASSVLVMMTFMSRVAA